MELTRIYFDYKNDNYMTENEYIGNHKFIDFDTALTIQRQELSELAENGVIEWKQAFELMGDFVAWNCLVDEWEEMEG